ncbi:hypothetical protein ES319_D04G202300v1 [Gossypium barbadense]|uniref:Uncharacterized protein n=2 Tax=Gossypium TaxID=3633 RepID=A0A5J5S2J1_GOSBA|nr:hypothetical protein ES319_D04G202300v1 [Gossypium barbadense]TYG74810.1 hypothetical protein ES288_D04G212700v1 [Gossypium darwinii]
MSVIGEVNLLTNHEARWRLLYRGHALPGGDNMYCITGTEWSRFVRTRINAMITLYSKEDDEDFHRVRVRQS